MRRGFRFLAVVGFTLVAVAALAGTTGKLSGTVVDDQSAPLPGVTMTIGSPALIGGSRVEVTGADGTFSFPGLTPGMYLVKAEISGFVTQERSEVQVRLDRTTEIDVQMPLSKFGEEITVVAETPVVDPTQVSTSQTFTSDFLKGAAISSGRRGYQSVLNMAPGVVGTNNPNVFGSTEGENAYFIDGLDTTDPVTATFGTNFNFDAIQEISFQTGGFEAEYGRATGGVVNLVTKSGGNDFSGTLDVRYRDTDFYESGDHFDKDLTTVKYLDPSVTFGGPIIRDKVWFFLSGEYVDSQNTPNEAPTTRKYVGENYIGKVTWQLNPSWRVTGKISGDPADIDNVNASSSRLPEATAFQGQGGDIYQADLAGILSPQLLFNFQVGMNRSSLDAYPQSGDLTTVGHFNDDTGVSSGNYTNAQYSERNRDEYKANLTWFVDNLAGSHELKGGVEYANLFFSSQNFYTGGGYYEDLVVDPEADLTPIPYLFWAQANAGVAETDGKLQTLFLQDAWKVMPNLTVKVGARYDAVSYQNDIGTKMGDMNMVQPRIGFAWDVKGDAKNLVKGSWGQFMHPNALTLPNFARTISTPQSAWFSCSTFLGTKEACQAYVAARASRGYLWQAGPDSWDPAGWFLNPRNVFSSAPNEIDPNLKPTYAEELIIGFEREIFDRTSLEFSYVNKKTKDIFEDTCDGNIPTPTADASCDFYIMTNIPGLKRDYEGYLLKFESRAKSWFHVLASYTYSKSQGNVEYTQNAGIDFDVYPYHFVNTYGYLSDDRTHRVKLNGYFLLPYDFAIGVDAFWSSAFAYNVEATSSTIPDIPYGTQFWVPRGSDRANGNYQIDLSVNKGFKVGPVNLELIASVLNVLGSEKTNGVCESYEGCYVGGELRSAGDATSWQRPRRYEVGFRIEF